ncbi:MAG: glycosyltransferase [Candidatus Marinimicrobia bacterium]|nr:glycosyltransferase [Candidatus Neomarinimicrobiota bacterium]
MRILHIGKYYTDVIGGIQSHIRDLASMQKITDQVTILVANTIPNTIHYKQDGLEFIKVASIGTIASVPISITFPFWLKKISKNYDIMHFHLMNPLSVVSMLITRPNCKIVATFHNDVIKQSMIYKLSSWLTSIFLRKIHKIIITSPNILNTSELLKVNASKCVIVPLGINTDKFIMTRFIDKNITQIKENFGGGIILFIGRLVDYKGVKYLIEAMNKVQGNLIIIGEGPLLSNLKQQVHTLGLKAKIHFLGKVSEEILPAYYYACDLFVLPSINNSEGYGLVQLEAQICGKPVISTDLPTGVPFVNVHNKTGLIVKTRDSDEISNSINILLHNRKLRLKLGEFGQKRVYQNFTRAKMKKNTDVVYNKLLKN